MYEHLSSVEAATERAITLSESTAELVYLHDFLIWLCGGSRLMSA